MGDLTGVTIGVTAERRADEFIAALERNGAAVQHAPLIHIVPLPDDLQLRAATDDVLAEDIDVLAVTTGAGFRGWLEAAEGWGVCDPLLATLTRARIFTRGPKGKGAVRGRGLVEEWSAPEESNRQLFGHLVDAGVSGLRVAVQLHGSPLSDHTKALIDGGARLIEVQPYRWEWPADMDPAYRLLDGVLEGRVQALAFTSAPATTNLLSLARQRGSYDELLHALNGDVVCACVGPVTAAPLTAIGVPTLQPERQRLGALVKLLVTELGS
jgi:uroporphyrinogen-III synthase